MLMMIKIAHWFQNKKKIFNELADKRLNKITELDKKVNCDDLIYKHKSKTSNEKFDKYDNALDLIDKTKNGEKWSRKFQNRSTWNKKRKQNT